MRNFASQLNGSYKPLIILIVFVLGLFIGMYLKSFSKVPMVYPVRENSTKYNYINPIILIDNSKVTYKELNPLKDDVEKYINKEISSQEAERISFYFRDMNSSAWTGVNADDKFYPASILKVVTMMTYLRSAEDDPNIMNQKLFYKNYPIDEQNYPPSLTLSDGYYNIGRLLGQSIIESDNSAEKALYENKVNEHLEALRILRLPAPPTPLADFMSPREVSNIFRSLYGSTYLLDSYSEQALGFLTQTNFKQGLNQGVDSNIKIAHKFGEYTIDQKDDTATPDYELHDCGIVYYPQKPYFICVMTEGKKFADLEKIIGQISSITFSYIKK